MSGWEFVEHHYSSLFCFGLFVVFVIGSAVASRGRRGDS